LDANGASGQHQPLTAAQDQLLTPVREQEREARPQAGQETVTGLFARQAGRTPDAVALSGPDTTLTYRELDARSTLLARTLTTRTAGAETVVAVALPRSTDLAVALLAVAKAGAAWLPLDPAAAAGSLTAPATRSSARALLTDPATAATLPADTDIPVI
ncbi:AMP-binding protein, partial [Streptomyces sp. NPDC127574]